MSFGVVLAKECMDNLRDKRTVMVAFSIALMGPALFVGLMIFVLNTALGESDDAAEFTVVGSEHAPQLMAHLEAQNTEITYIQSDDPAQLVIDGTHKLILVINDDYAERYRQGLRNTLAVIHDSSQFSSTRRHLAVLQGHINAYSQTIGFLRLQLRGIDASITRPITTQEIDVASPAARALSILSSLPYFFVLVVFMGGFYLAIDTTAGEREHGSLEPLLTQPVSRTQLVMGKIMAAATFGAASLLLFLVSLYFAVPLIPFERIGMALEINILQLAEMFMIAIPLLIFAAGLLTVVASFAKSYKEAQTYLTMVIFVPTMPLIFAQLANVETSLKTMFVPSLSQANLISDIITGDAPAWGYVLISMGTTSIYAALMCALSIYLYRREQILG